MHTSLPEPLSLPWDLKSLSWAQAGFQRLSDGRRRFWSKEELKSITPAMLVWWFSHLEGDINIAGRRLPRYRVWHPFDHVSVQYVRRGPDGSIGPGAHIAVYEVLGRNPRYTIKQVSTIEKLDEEEFIHHIEVSGLVLARIEHTFKPMLGGTAHEHSLTLPGSPQWLGKLVAPLLFPSAEGEAWLKHAIEEMGALENFLPQLYQYEASEPNQLTSSGHKTQE